MRRAQILVMGGANLDIKSRLLNQPTGSSDPAIIQMGAGGVARNVAHNLALLGHTVTLLAPLGKDIAADIIRYDTNPNVTWEAMEVKEGRTGIYNAMLDPSGELIQAASDMQIVETLTVDIVQPFLNRPYDLIFADCNLASSSLAFLMKASSTIPLFIDPVSKVKAAKLRPLLGIRPLHLSPNIEELEILTEKTIKDHDSMIAACDELHQRDVLSLLVGGGKKGATLSKQGGKFFNFPSLSTNIEDVTGAGDASCAGYIHSWLQDWGMEESLKFSQKMAALACASKTSIAEGIENDIHLQ